EEFHKLKGYDITSYLPAIFEDIGDITPKIRLDYYDVIVLLSEEGYFKPIYEWHVQRGMTLGCDHGGRGKNIIEFGDYFRIIKWNQGPGNDQPELSSNIIKNKVSSSISHMYKRPRTWLEGFYASGWGTSSGDVADAVFRNFAMGHNLLSLHGLYYSTYGTFWEWAPPCNHYHMPYWEHMKPLLGAIERLSFLLCQGIHGCDVAIVYPVAAVEGGVDGEKAVNTAFEVAEHLYPKGIDFDFIDFESIERAAIQDGKLCVSDEEFKFLVRPSMKTIRFSTIEKARDFANQGGVVIFIGDLPQASEHAGRNDEVLNNIFDYAIYAHTLNLDFNSETAKGNAALNYFGVKAGNLKNTLANGEQLYDSIPDDSPKTGINKDIFFDYYKNNKTEFELICLLAFLAFKSIIGFKKPYCKTTNKYWFSRMDGKVKSIEEYDELSPDVFKFLTDHYTVKIKNELEDHWGLKTYSHYTRGFYVSFTIPLDDLVFHAEKRRQSTRDEERKAQKKEAIQKAFDKIKNKS
ncbi:MAG: glycosyl hydrolase, partial [Bacillota bacterium]|nr:glycosyl hydrolase [Bacillota bacterium]